MRERNERHLPFHKGKSCALKVSLYVRKLFLRLKPLLRNLALYTETTGNGP